MTRQELIKLAQQAGFDVSDTGRISFHLDRNCLYLNRGCETVLSDGLKALCEAVFENGRIAGSKDYTKGMTKRKAFICVNCEGVYADVPVSECDCQVGVESIFKKGFILYKEDEVKK